MAGIRYIDYHLPNKFIQAKDVISKVEDLVLPEFYNSFDDYFSDFFQQSGLEKITIENYEYCIELFSELLGKFFTDTQIDPAKVSYIFYTNPKCMNLNGVNIPYLLQQKFQMKNAYVTVIDQGCTGTIWSMGLSKSLLESDGEQYSIILSASFLHEAKNRYLFPTIGGDALGLMVLSNHLLNYNIIDCISISDGIYSYNKYNKKTDNAINKLAIVKKGSVAVERLLHKNNLRQDDIFLMIPQSINKLSYTTIYPTMLKIRPEKVFVENIANGGHLGDVDTIRNLKDCIESYTVPPYAYILLYGQGIINGDLNYNSLLLQYVPSAIKRRNDE